MITLQYYEDEDKLRVFDSDNFLADIVNPDQGMTVDEYNEMLDKLGVERGEWKQTDWGWQCELNTD